MPRAATDQMHLFAMPMGGGAHAAGWRHPLAGDTNLHDIAHYRRSAEIAERGKFDAIFLADAQGFRPVAGKNAYSCIDALRMDPVTILSAVAMATTHIGLIATLSTSYNEPYSAARRLATLDHISGGRAGWNVVTSTSENEAHNFGREAHFAHAERYARAEEFLAVAKGLWDGWEDNAVVVDRANGRFFEPDRVHALAHEGSFFRVAGPMTMGRTPQGRPVIVQAGASDEGLSLAVREAEAVFTSNPDRAGAQRFYATLKDMVAAAGRARESLKILTAVQPVIADSQAEAEAIATQLDELIPYDLALSILQMQLGGVDLSQADPERPLPSLPEGNASQSGRQRIIDQAQRERLTLRQTARQVAGGRTSKMVAGTPEHVADLLETWFRTEAADGFVIAPPILPDMLVRFVDMVVPILQRRGVFRTDYVGATLRDHLSLARPDSRYTDTDRPRVEPEMWQSAR